MAGHWQPCDLSFSKSQSNFSSKFFERTNAGITVWSLSFCHSPITHHQWIMAIRDLEVNRSEIKLSCPSFCCFKTNHRAIIRPGTRGVSTATIGFILLLMNLHDKYQPPFWPPVKWRAPSPQDKWCYFPPWITGGKAGRAPNGNVKKLNITLFMQVQMNALQAVCNCYKPLKAVGCVQ